MYNVRFNGLQAETLGPFPSLDEGIAAGHDGFDCDFDESFDVLDSDGVVVASYNPEEDD